MLVKLELVTPGAGAALSAKLVARGSGIFSNEGVELTMCAVFTTFLTAGREGRSW